MAVKRLLLLALIVTSTVQAADAPFGDIPANLSLSTSQSVRRNAANNGFEAFTPGGGGGTPGGSNTQVQFNDSNAFGGDAGLTYNKTTDALTLGGAFNAATGKFVIEGTSGSFYGADGDFAVNSNGSFIAGVQYDSLTGTNISIDANNRLVYKSDGSTVSFDWDNLKFPTLTTNGFVTTSGGNGTIGVKAIVGGFTAHFSRGGAAIQTNDVLVTPWTCPYSGTITGYSISANTGTCTLKTWKKANGTAIPTIADVINTSGVALSSGTHIRSSTVSDFTTTTVTAGDMFMAQVTSTSGPTDITFQVEITR